MTKPIKDIPVIDSIKARSNNGTVSHWEDIPYNFSRLIHSFVRVTNRSCLVPNFRLIKAEFIPMTDKKPTRLKISEEARSLNDRKRSKIIPVHLNGEHLQEVAYKYLKEKGFNIVSKSTTKDAVFFHCDNWAEEFIEINNI